MMKSTAYGTSLEGTANDVAFALAVLTEAGFSVVPPSPVDFRDVARRMLGVSDEVGIEHIVTAVADALVGTKQS